MSAADLLPEDLTPEDRYRLSEAAGIVPGYWDIWGNRHELNETARASLLGDLGLLDAATRAAFEAGDAPRGLAPVIVLQDGEATQAMLIPPAGADGALHWRIVQEDGAEHAGEVDVQTLESAGPARLLGLPELPHGYHRLEVRGAGLDAACVLIRAPRRAYQAPEVEQGARWWGLGVQLYSVRSRRNWGMGDFTDLAKLVAWAAARGAKVVGLNPLHAGFLANPGDFSPYSPSSRLFRNVLYLDVEAVPGLAECAAAQATMRGRGFQEALAQLRGAERVNWPALAALKVALLRLVYGDFVNVNVAPATRKSPLALGERGRGRGNGHGERAAFRAWLDEEGAPLRLYCAFETLDARFRRQHDASGWRDWPEDFRNPDSDAVHAFMREHGAEIEFHAWLQWHAERQLLAVAEKARALGVCLYGDLAVGAERGGAETWAAQDSFALDASVGCPPDEFNLKGQNWGLPPWNPHRLRAHAFEPFVQVLREAMRDMGVLRIDHVMALMRLYWIPHGLTAVDGGYVSYPLRELLAILALESQRARCMVIGEDLGTVPDEVRHALYEAGVLSYRLLYFAKDGARFLRSDEYPRQAAVAVTTHDLPPLAGFWASRDLEVKDQLDLFPSPEVRERQRVGRLQDREALLVALKEAGLVPWETDTAALEETALAVAAYRLVARSPGMLCMVQMEDLFGMREQMNMPGTVHEHPNWRRKLPVALEDWDAHPGVEAVLGAVREERG
jgi:(1->4)-alpha-D-glucan 1-alpha-D-glucosylmutase